MASSHKLLTNLILFLGLISHGKCQLNPTSAAFIGQNFCNLQNATFVDNFSCSEEPTGSRCFNASELCDDTSPLAPAFCSQRSDEGERSIFIDCENSEFRCEAGNNTISVFMICNGINNCIDGSDERVAICNNKCLLPYYGGCSLSRQCLNSRDGVECGGCAFGFVEFSQVQEECNPIRTFSFEQSVINTFEGSLSPVEVCVLLSSELSANFTIQPVNITINLAFNCNGTLDADYTQSGNTVVLSTAISRACVTITIIDDDLDEDVELLIFEMDIPMGNEFVVATPAISIVNIFDNDAASSAPGTASTALGTTTIASTVSGTTTIASTVPGTTTITSSTHGTTTSASITPGIIEGSLQQSNETCASLDRLIASLNPEIAGECFKNTFCTVVTCFFLEGEEITFLNVQFNPCNVPVSVRVLIDIPIDTFPFIVFGDEFTTESQSVVLTSPSGDMLILDIELISTNTGVLFGLSLLNGSGSGSGSDSDFGSGFDSDSNSPPEKHPDFLWIFTLKEIPFQCSLITPLRRNFSGRGQIASAILMRPEDGQGPCPSKDFLATASQSTDQQILLTIQDLFPAVFSIPGCGSGNWVRVASFNFSDLTQQCPSPWIEAITPVRSCMSPLGSSCQGPVFQVPEGAGMYTRVCGHITGYGVGSPDAFNTSANSLDSFYLDGVSVTYGSPRQHIWSFAAGLCQCDDPDLPNEASPPLFVGNNYFCEFHEDESLWDGVNCQRNCCIFNSPPLFNVTLPASTTNSIEVRICSDQDITDERVHISLLELFVQ